MRISIVIAMDRNPVRGRARKRPRIRPPAAQNWFQETIADKPVVMGRKTHESLGGSLPGRFNVVLTRNRKYEAEDCLMLHSVKDVLEVMAEFEDVMVIGGMEIFRQFLHYASKVYLIVVGRDPAEDFYSLPEDWSRDWRTVERKEVHRGNYTPYDLTFLVLERIDLAHS